MFSKFKSLPRDFYMQSAVEVAQSLIGKILIFNDHLSIITETEAYCGFEDEASHAFRGKTKRTSIMFEEGGYSYVYFIYGMYHCLNFVAGQKDYPAAVLIRAAKLLTSTPLHINGPGKLCKLLGITREHSAIDTVNSKLLFAADGNLKLPFITTPRIGITKATDKLWRYKVEAQDLENVGLHSLS
jgi:DNA-3-methyladenine glycosylase